MRTPRRKRPSLAVMAAVVAMVAMVCSSGTSAAASSGGSAPGVTSSTITVASLATSSGALSSGFVDLIYGVKAYLDMVNAHGGVDGRKIIWSKVADDQASPTTDEIQARNLVEQDHVFAIVGVATPFFESGPYLASTGTPTFGYLVEGGWNKYPNLFGAYGSEIGYNTRAGVLTYVAHEEHAQSVAVLAYGFVATSKDACQAAATGMKRNGVNVAYQDLDMTYLEDPTSDVEQMAAHHTDLVLTCLDGPEDLSIAESLHQYGVNAKEIWENGYDRATVRQNAAALSGDLFYLQHVPFEAVQEFPGKYPSMAQYIATMNKYEPTWTYDDISFQGWVNAELFVAGLRAVGRDLTQQKLVNAINKMTDFTAGGLIAPVNWKTAHTKSTPPFCSAWLQVTTSGKYQSVLVQHGDQTYMCFGATSPTVLPFPAGVEPNG